MFKIKRGLGHKMITCHRSRLMWRKGSIVSHNYGSWLRIMTSNHSKKLRHCSSVNGNWENWFANWFWFEPQVESELRCRLDTWLAMAFLGLDFMLDLVALVHSGTNQTTMTTLASLYLSCSSLYQNMSLYSWTLLQQHRFNKRSTSLSMANWSFSFFLNQQGIDYIEKWNWIHKQELPSDLRKSHWVHEKLHNKLYVKEHLFSHSHYKCT